MSAFVQGLKFASKEAFTSKSRETNEKCSSIETEKDKNARNGVPKKSSNGQTFSDP